MAMTSSLQEQYTWTFPGAPIRVCIQLEVIRHLQELLTPKAGSGNAVSIGRTGVLLGKIGGVNGTEVAAAIASVGDGPDAIATTLSSLKASRDLEPVGFYSAVPGPELRLSDHDFSVAGRFFSDPRNVFLIIGLKETGADKGTFFFWDENKIHRDFTILEFPFDASRLAAKEGQRAARTRDSRVTEAAAMIPEPAQLPPRQPGHRRPKWVWSAAVVAVLAIVFAGVRYLKMPVSRLNAGAPAPVVDIGTPLGLKFEHQGSDLVVAWDRDAGARYGATAGLLSIRDGAGEKAVGLSMDMLNAGRVFISPQTNQVQVQLTLLVPNQRTVTESGMAILSSRGSAAMSVSSVALPARSVAAERVASAVPKSIPVRKFAVPDGRVPESRAVVDDPPVLQAPDLNLTAAPALSPLVSPAPAQPPSAASQTATGAASPPATPSVPAAVSAVKAPATSAPYAVQPAEYISGPKPAYPAAARDAHIEGVVVVEALVGTDGAVKQAKPISGHKLLMNAASRAVLLWTFKPATINGKPVEAPVRVEVKFHGSR